MHVRDWGTKSSVAVREVNMVVRALVSVANNSTGLSFVVLVPKKRKLVEL